MKSRTSGFKDVLKKTHPHREYFKIPKLDPGSYDVTAGWHESTVLLVSHDRERDNL